MKMSIELRSFLNLHELSAEEIADKEYVASFVYNYYENQDLEISDEDALKLANQY